MSKRANVIVVGGFNNFVAIQIVIVFVYVVIDELLGPLNLSKGPLDLPDVLEFLVVAGEGGAISRCVPFLLVIELD